VSYCYHINARLLVKKTKQNKKTVDYGRVACMCVYSKWHISCAVPRMDVIWPSFTGPEA